jgi:hypothetical protein
MNSVDSFHVASNGIPYWMASIFFPGWGQLCQDRKLVGLIHLVCIPALYFLDWRFGLLCHLVSVIDAFRFATRGA